MVYNLRNLLSLVWRWKWEGIVAIVGLFLAVIAGEPNASYVLLITAAVFIIVLLFDIRGGIKEARSFLRVKHIPIVVIVGKGDDARRAMLNDVFATVAPFGFDEECFAKDLNIFRDDLIVHRVEALPPQTEAWAELARLFESKINRLAARLRGQRVYHIFLNCPVALALGLGAMLRTLYEVVLYQYQPGTQPPYVPVVDFYALSQESGPGTALLHEPVTEHRFTAVEEADQLTSRTFVSVHLFSRDPRADVEKLAQDQNAAGVHIRNTYGSSLSPTDDWLTVAREIQTIVRDLMSRPEVKRQELSLSSYLPLAFAIGMALGTQYPITVHSWYSTDQEFKPVLELNRLRPTR